MIQRTKWIERQFTFDAPAGWLPNILERLRGTPARIRELVSALDEATCELKPGGRWSMKEQIGHLIDLEEIHDSRIDDFLARRPVLRAADISNARTNQANHNQHAVGRLLEVFSKQRNHFAARLAELDDETRQFQSLHPRLNVPLRAVDLAFFAAEHDDYHMAHIREIINQSEDAAHKKDHPMLFMVIESFHPGKTEAIYHRFEQEGRLLPEGMRYVNSWIDQDVTRCYQVMECDDPSRLREWIGQWIDLADFQIVHVQTSAQARERVKARGAT